MSNLFSKNYFREILSSYGLDTEFFSPPIARGTGLLPNRSRSGDLDLQSGAAPVVRDRLIANSLPACLGHGEGQALALR